MSFGASKPAVTPLPVMPSKEDPAVAEAERLERERQKKAMGRAGTILTSGEGVLGDTGSVSQKKSLLTSLGA